MKNQSNNTTLLINETFIIDHSIHDKWLSAFKNGYLSVLKEKKNITGLIFSKIRDEYNPDGVNYALQFQIKEKDFNNFKRDDKLISIRKEINLAFGNKTASFITILDIVVS